MTGSIRATQRIPAFLGRPHKGPAERGHIKKHQKVSNRIYRARTKGSCNHTRLLEGFLEGSSKEVLLRRVLRRRLVWVSVGREILRRALRRGFMEAA